MIICVTRSGLARISSKSIILSITSRYSLTILSCSSPVKRCKRSSRIAWACVSESRYARCSPCPDIPNSGARFSGRDASLTRLSNSSTSEDRHVRAIKPCLAIAGVAAALISAMISSTLESATAKPSRMWPRSRALRKSNIVRRVTTSRRWRRKASRNCFKLSSLG